MHVSMYVCMQVCMYMCMRVCEYVCSCVPTYLCVCVYVSLSVLLNRVRTPAVTRCFALLQNAETGSRGHAASFSVSTGGSFPSVNSVVA